MLTSYTFKHTQLHSVVIDPFFKKSTHHYEINWLVFKWTNDTVFKSISKVPVDKIVPLIPLHQHGTFIVYSTALKTTKIKSREAIISW